VQDLRSLECLIALARYRHFAKAAEHCGLSQPAFSMRIRSLEERLNTRIVKRGNRFQGLTREGERVLAHAKSIIGRVRALEEEVQAGQGRIVGSLAIGTIPTTEPYAARLAYRLRSVHPGITTSIETGTSLAIQQGVDDGRFDAGITYTEGAATDLLEVDELYDERYALLLPDDLAPGERETITWAEAGALPLILLEPDMQNRRIIDRVFRDLGVAPDVVAETDGFMAAVVMATLGMGATVIPEVLRTGLGTFAHMRFLPLVAPEVEKSVCLVTLRQEAALPAVLALRSLVSSGA
jgi:DNA-binding transcriptional LysR family regulator